MQSQLAPLAKLSSGHTIPMAGLGLYKITEGLDVVGLLQHALDTGYRHFDTAILYDNEKCIGNAFQQIFDKKVYKREDIFLTSKVFPFKGKSIVEQVENSLKDLQTPYIDLYLLHWPSIGPNPKDNSIQHQPIHVAWKQLEECYDKGYVKSIGVSNYNVQTLFDLLSYARVKPSVNQVELHVYLQQQGLNKFCDQFDIHMTAYCPLGRGGDMFKDPLIVKLAEKYQKTPAQIMLNFISSVLKISVIPKTEKVQRLKENFDWRDFEFTEEEIIQLKSLNKNFRLIDPQDREFLGNIALFD